MREERAAALKTTVTLKPGLDHVREIPAIDSPAILPRLSRVLVVALLVPLLGGCYFSRSSELVCECEMAKQLDRGELKELSAAPRNYSGLGTWPSSLDLPEEFEIQSKLEQAEVHWFEVESGESLGCYVFKGSDRVNVILTLSSDESGAEPVEALVLGPPFGTPRRPWEKC